MSCIHNSQLSVQFFHNRAKNEHKQADHTGHCARALTTHHRALILAQRHPADRARPNDGSASINDENYFTSNKTVLQVDKTNATWLPSNAPE